MTYHDVCNKINTTGTASGAFSEVCVAQSLVFCIIFYRSLFVLFLLAFGIFKLFLSKQVFIHFEIMH